MICFVLLTGLTLSLTVVAAGQVSLLVRLPEVGDRTTKASFRCTMRLTRITQNGSDLI
jgi:hypothetical protein